MDVRYEILFHAFQGLDFLEQRRSLMNSGMTVIGFFLIFLLVLFFIRTEIRIVESQTVIRQNIGGMDPIATFC